MANVIMIGVALLYVLVTTGVGVYMKKHSRTSSGFMTGKKQFGAVVIGVLMMSEFISVGSTIGAAQTAFLRGISAAWSVFSAALAYIAFAFFLAKKFHERSEYTISGAIARSYGNHAKIITSLIMTYALIVTNVAIFAGGAAMLAVVLHVPKVIAVIIVGVVTVVNVAAGGMAAVAYTNIAHVIMKYVAVFISFAVGLVTLGGVTGVRVHVPPQMLNWTGVGWPTIIAWTIGNMGAIFSTQYVIQAVTSTKDARKARLASVYAGLLIVPIAFMIALIGVMSKVIFPTAPSDQALPILVTLMNPMAGGLVVAGLIAAVLSSSSAIALACAALLLKDVYLPLVNKNATDLASLRFSRVATVVMGLIPIPFAIFVPQILNTVFFARALRTTIAVVVLLMFYAPRFSGGRGASIGLISAAFAATAWYTLGNPYGIDSIYVACVTPVLVMAIDHCVTKQRQMSLRHKTAAN